MPNPTPSPFQVAADTSSFRDDIETMLAIGQPIHEDQSQDVVTNAKDVFLAIADKCDSMDQALGNKANDSDVVHKTEVDSTLVIGSDNPVAGKGVVDAVSQFHPRYLVEDNKTVLSQADGTRSIVNTTTSLTYNDVKNVSDHAVGVYLGSGVTSIGRECFSFCEEIKKVDLANVTSIGRQAFVCNFALTELIADKVETLDSAVFGSCRALKLAKFPALQYISQEAFEECESLEYIYLPSIQGIESQAFLNCTSLKVIDFGNELTAVPEIAGADIFGSVPQSCVLIIPDALFEVWKAAWTQTGLGDYHYVSWSDWQYVRHMDLDAALEEIKSGYLKVGEKINGEDVIMGGSDYAESLAHNNNANNILTVYFTTESLGMHDGELLKTISVKTRAAQGTFQSKTVCVKIGKWDSQLQLGVTDYKNVSQFNTFYTFTFKEPVRLAAGQKYKMCFFPDEGESATSTTLQVALNVTASDSDIYCEDNSHTAHPTWRPILKADYYIPATVTSVDGLIDKRAQQVQTKLRECLSDVNNLSVIGSNDYDSDGLKDRLDVIIDALKQIYNLTL